MTKQIALVEDDRALRDNYVSALTKQGYEVKAYANRPEAEAAFTKQLPDLAIVDIGLEDEIDGGFAVCQTLRSLSKTLPIIFFTARDNDYDTICGLRMGADDYLTKDISLPHLLARIAALFRRTALLNEPQVPSDLIQSGNLVMDAKRMTVQWKGQLIELTVTEFWMLHAIAKFAGHVKSRQQLMDESKMVVDDTTITSHIKRVRKKFIQLDATFDRIETVYGMGYRWKSENSDSQSSETS
ncbi:MAG: two-component system OmpR family response regulator [Glaciecola sp.]|jgi:two-component system OmpR family response regulator